MDIKKKCIPSDIFCDRLRMTPNLKQKKKERVLMLFTVFFFNNPLPRLPIDDCIRQRPTICVLCTHQPQLKRYSVIEQTQHHRIGTNNTIDRRQYYCRLCPYGCQVCYMERILFLDVQPVEGIKLERKHCLRFFIVGPLVLTQKCAKKQNRIIF